MCRPILAGASSDVMLGYTESDMLHKRLFDTDGGPDLWWLSENIEVLFDSGSG